MIFKAKTKWFVSHTWLCTYHAGIETRCSLQYVSKLVDRENITLWCKSSDAMKLYAEVLSPSI